MPLSERQFGAAHRLGQDVCVVAGPGSGKTSVLIERFSWLVTKRGFLHAAFSRSRSLRKPPPRFASAW